MERTQKLYTKGTHDEVFDLVQHVRELQEAPLTTDEAGELAKIEAIEMMREQIVDESPSSQAADTLVNIMTEFADDYHDYGEVFQPSVDPDLMQFLIETLEREHPDLAPEDLADLLAQVRDFPPPSQA